MKPTRSALLIVSGLLFVVIMAGGLAMKAGAGESSYRQVVVFSEVLSLVLDNYVDPVEAEKLLAGAYEGMLGGLDANGAFLTREEVQQWKSQGGDGASGDPGVSVLKSGRALQIVAVAPGSPADEAGLIVGDQIRGVGGAPIRDLSLTQARRKIRGVPGTSVKLEVMHPHDGFRREELELVRRERSGAAYDLDVKKGIAVLRILEMDRVPVEDLARELDEVRSRGVETLMLDLRNAADSEPRHMVAAGGLFASGKLLRLRDGAGRVLETFDNPGEASAWPGRVAVLVNGATAGSGEALARLLQAERDGIVMGESTYGLGAEVSLFELENGAGLLVSSALWETGSGRGWNGDGIEPDHAIRGEGDDYPSAAADQLRQALEYLDDAGSAEEPVQEAA